MTLLRLCAVATLVTLPAAGRATSSQPRSQETEDPPVPRVAAVVTAYYHNSHADVIVSRLLQGYTLDGQGEFPRLQLVSLYTDQVPENDISRRLAAEHGIPVYETVADALTLGTGELAVDGVLLVAEHGDYPRSETGQIVYPKRRLFEQVVEVFRRSGRVVPVFIDKHLADNWEDASWIHETAREMGIPLMAGSSLPMLWRYPPVDVERGARLEEIVAVSYHTLDAYGFHALEMVQCLAERRQRGETGIAAVQCFTGDAVWQAGRDGVYDGELLEAALARLRRPIPEGRALQELVPEPVLFVIDYADGLRTSVLTLNGAVGEWAAAWRYAHLPEGRAEVESALFWTQEARPFMHFTYLLRGIEHMMLTGEPAWPAQRTLMTSGALDALLVSQHEGGRRVETPYLTFSYETEWDWDQPPPPPPDRPIDGQ